MEIVGIFVWPSIRHGEREREIKKYSIASKVISSYEIYTFERFDFDALN